MKRVAVLQSNYIPWKGYFDIIHDADEFIFHDDLQYTKNDWRNRNQIITQDGKKWLTIPVGTNEHRLILDVRMKDHSWQIKHFDILKMAYHKAPFFKIYEPFLHYVYVEKSWEYLYELNRYLIETISKDFLRISVHFTDSRSYSTHGKKSEKLLSLLRAAQADIYISGPAGKNYISAEEYISAKIQIQWKDYSNYPIYPQTCIPFTHHVSIWDLLFNVGEDAPYYIWGWRNKEEGGC